MDTINKILRFRVDLLGTSEDTKPLDAPNGSTFYEVDTYKFFIKWGSEWLEQNATNTNNTNTRTSEKNNER